MAQAECQICEVQAYHNTVEFRHQAAEVVFEYDSGVNEQLVNRESSTSRDRPEIYSQVKDITKGITGCEEPRRETQRSGVRYR